MGFEEEVLRKYPGPNGRVLLAACQKVRPAFRSTVYRHLLACDMPPPTPLTRPAAPHTHVRAAQVFDCMPLCALIQEKIFVVHGGLFSREGVALEHIRGISRKREPPVHSEVFEVGGWLDLILI